MLNSLKLNRGQVAILAVLAGLLAWVGIGFLVSHDWRAPPVGQHGPATPAPAVAKVATVATPIQAGTVRTYRPEAKRALKLPEAVQAAPEQQVIAASTVRPDSHAYTLTTLINTETGEVETLQRREPLPWLGRDPSGHADLLLGYRDGGPVARLSITQNLMQVKALRLGVAGSVTQSLGATAGTEWLLGLNLGMTW